MADEIFSISQKELENSLINMMLESAEESFSADLLEDSIDYTRAILAVFPSHSKANHLLNLALEKKRQELLTRNVDELQDNEIDELLSYLIEHGVTAGAFGLSDLDQLDSPELKRQLVKFLQERLRK